MLSVIPVEIFVYTKRHVLENRNSATRLTLCLNTDLRSKCDTCLHVAVIFFQ